MRYQIRRYDKKFRRKIQQRLSIYAKDECLYNNLSESQFNNKWETLKGMVGLMKTDYEIGDLSYEEVELIRHTTDEHSY